MESLPIFLMICFCANLQVKYRDHGQANYQWENGPILFLLLTPSKFGGMLSLCTRLNIEIFYHNWNNILKNTGDQGYSQHIPVIPKISFSHCKGVLWDSSTGHKFTVNMCSVPTCIILSCNKIFKKYRKSSEMLLDFVYPNT